MDRTIQDLAWTCLPKEFKEEVKKIYSSYTNPMAVGFESHIITCEYIFGKHNLTSDAEGEEMLMVSRKDIVELYQEVNKTISQCKGTGLATQSIGIKNVLWSFFGSKCLPDENSSNIERLEKNGEVDSLESKFKYSVGDEVKYKSDGKVYKIGFIDKKPTSLPYQLKNGIWVSESDLEPYTEPKENIAESRKTSQNCDKEFDNILKDSFTKERRLNIAAMIMAAMMQNAKWGDKYSHIATMSCAAADALIAESEKGDTK